jgi:hypothetical protein
MLNGRRGHAVEPQYAFHCPPDEVGTLPHAPRPGRVRLRRLARRALIQKLADLSFTNDAQNVVLVGGLGTGKTHPYRNSSVQRITCVDEK